MLFFFSGYSIVTVDTKIDLKKYVIVRIIPDPIDENAKNIVLIKLRYFNLGATTT
jgi:hypothetical protein